MEGNAITWYQELEETGILTSWEAFIKALKFVLEPHLTMTPWRPS
jgi:hypothetical protein